MVSFRFVLPILLARPVQLPSSIPFVQPVRRLFEEALLSHRMISFRFLLPILVARPVRLPASDFFVHSVLQLVVKALFFSQPMACSQYL